MIFSLVACGADEDGEAGFFEKLTHQHDFKAATCTDGETCDCGEEKGEPLGHRFDDATCTTPKVCIRCQAEEGEPLGHDFDDATCMEAAKCKICGEIDGEPLGHNYVDNVCSVCDEVDPDSLPVGLENKVVIDSKHCDFLDGEFVDTYGNAYDNACHFYYIGNTDSSKAIFNINKEYKTFTASIAGCPDASSEAEMIVYVYVDDVLKYTSKPFDKTDYLIDFSVDISGGRKLTIKTGLKSGYWGDACLSIVNAELYKK